MTRPTSFKDLSDSDQQGPRIASFEPSLFLTLPRKTLIRVLKTIESLDKDVADGLLDKEGTVEDGDEIIYRFRPTEKDRERKLRSAQYSWDQSKELYERALTDPDSVPCYMYWNVDAWAKNENKPAIQWPNMEND